LELDVRMPSSRLRLLHHNSRYSRLSTVLTSTCALITLATVGTPALAQGWDPFSQLETNRLERRSTRPVRKPPEVSNGNWAAPTGANAPQDTYLDPTNARPYAAEPSRQTYYPRPATSQPGYGRTAPTPAPSAPPPSTAPSSISVETLAPLPPGPNLGAPALSMPDSTPQRPGGGLAARQQVTPWSATGGEAQALPSELWRGLDIADVEHLIASLEIPPRSPALHQLWRRLIVADVATPQGGDANAHFEALRLEALYRSGLLKEITQALNAQRSGLPNALVAMLEARSEIGLGHREAGCEGVKRIGDIRGDIPKSLRGEAILVSGYCAAATGNKSAAGLLAELAREEGVRSSPGLAALDAVALGVKTDISLAKGQKLSLIDYRILELAGAAPPRQELIKTAAPALLVSIADDAGADPDLRLDAGEAAARINAYDPQTLAALYRAIAGRASTAKPSSDASNNGGGANTSLHRALLFTSAQSEHTLLKKVRLIRTFIDSSRRAGLYLPALAMTARLTDDVGLVPEIGWFAETAIEANLAAGNYQNARKWAKFAASAANDRGRNLDYWMALIDIADPHFAEPRGQSLMAVEKLALKGQFSPETLHRLATVLDALDYNVPIPLWETASKTPQPTSGHLPETGVLSQLQDAAKKGEFARTVLLTMQTLGPDGAEGAHIIALGDSIRALKRAGLEADARQLGFEALLPGWPHVLTN